LLKLQLELRIGHLFANLLFSFRWQTSCIDCLGGLVQVLCFLDIDSGQWGRAPVRWALGVAKTPSLMVQPYPDFAWWNPGWSPWEDSGPGVGAGREAPPHTIDTGSTGSPSSLARPSMCHAMVHELAYNQLPLKKIFTWIVSILQMMVDAGW
jgi:hypothetical protein